MRKNVFGTVCLVLAGLFTLAAIKGIFADFGAVLIIPAMCAVALVVVGLTSRRKNISS